MQELRFVSVSEDGSYAVLAVPGRSGRFILPIDERLRAVALGQTSRLAQYEIEVESPLRPKEIQARIRAGETAEEIADAAGIPVERVRWFEGPVLAERAYIADQAQSASVRRAGDSAGPGPRLGDIVSERLSASGADPEDGQWDSRKRGDGNWQVTLTFPSGGRLHVAEWVFDPRRRHVMPEDDNAARLSLPESELPPVSVPVPVPGEATVTPLAPRLGAAAGMGGGPGGFAGGGSGVGVRSFRPERSVIPDRSLGVDRSLAAERHVPREHMVTAERPALPEQPAMSHAPAPAPVLPRPAQPDRSGYHDQATARPVTATPAAYRDYPHEPAAPGDGAGATELPVPAPARHVVFEEPEPGLLAEPFEPAPAAAVADPAPAAASPAPSAADPAPAVVTASVTAPEQPAAEPVSTVSAGPVTITAAAPAGTPTTRALPGQSQPATVPAARLADAAEPVTTAHSAAGSAATAPAPAAAAAAPEPPAAPAPAPAAETALPEAGAADTATAGAVTAGTATADTADTATTDTAAAGTADTAGTATTDTADTTTADAADTTTADTATVETEAAQPAASATSAPADTPAAEEQSARPRSGGRKNAKGRRSSVPSWDEIMLGSSRQRD